MDTPVNKAELLERIQRSREAWDLLLLPLDNHTLLQPGFCGEWSAKDVIAHVAWYEKEMISMIEGHALEGSVLWDLPLEQRNAAIYEQNQDRSLEDVQQESKKVYAQLVENLQTLSEEDLHDPGRFTGMPEDWVPWEVIASNTFEHYDDHAQQAQIFHAQ